MEAASIAVIDTKTMAVSTTHKLPDCEGPAALGFDPANRRLFSSCGNGQLKVVDADSGRIISSLPVGEDPDGIVFDPDSRRIFVGARDGRMTIIKQGDANSYAVEQELKTQEYAKTLAFDPKSHRTFSSTAELVWPKGVPGKKLLPTARPGSFHLVVYSPN